MMGADNAEEFAGLQKISSGRQLIRDLKQQRGDSKAMRGVASKQGKVGRLVTLGGVNG